MLVTTKFTPFPQALYVLKNSHNFLGVWSQQRTAFIKQVSRNSLVNTTKKLNSKPAVLNSQHDKKLQQRWNKNILANCQARSAPRLVKIISHEITRTDKTNTKARGVSSELVIRKVQIVTTMYTHQEKKYLQYS